MVSSKKFYILFFILFNALYLSFIYVLYRELPEKPFKNLEFSHKPLTQEELVQKQCIEEALHYEARGEGNTGLLAVASVLHNRKNDGRWQDPWCSVVHAPWQFSYRNRIKPGEIFDISSKVQLEITEIAEAIVKQEFKPVFDSSVLFYHTLDASPDWSAKMQQVAVIGRHVFYREIKGQYARSS